ncbi:right-handed parallel beta-helix repeat-containing protein [Phytohabitans kaempferiae]|uniref:Right-handed parallel beta-helix repeat-containing protein n=1 Tax=Phytohabitans kaempferiae TaxID=1620943 RepID=A0ABV6MBQ6_9ACTN
MRARVDSPSGGDRLCAGRRSWGLNVNRQGVSHSHERMLRVGRTRHRRRRNPVTVILPVAALLAALVTVGVARASVAQEPKTNAAQLALGLYVRESSDRQDVVPLNRREVEGKIYVTAEGEGISAVSFWLDDPSRRPHRVERERPFDFAGNASDGSANAFDTTKVSNGNHVVFAEITLTGGEKVNAWASFTVNNRRTDGPAPTPTKSPTKPSPSPATPAPTTPAPPPPPPSGGGKCPLPAYPSPACTGVPAGTALTTINGSYTATKAGEVVSGKRITGRLLVAAPNVVVRNSEIYGGIRYAGSSHNERSHSFTISDSTLGAPSGCDQEYAVGHRDYTASRVLVRNFGDAFRNSGNNILIEDSYARICAERGFHSDGVQGYGGGSNVVVRHNTIDQRNLVDGTSPIFFSDGSKGATIVDNLLAGGGYTARMYGSGYTFTGNRIVNGSWGYGPADNDCGGINWSDNAIVEIDGDYRITARVGDLRCN